MAFYSHNGRPSVDPELMVRILLIGYSFGIRSERRLCEEVHLNLAYRRSNLRVVVSWGFLLSGLAVARETGGCDTQGLAARQGVCTTR
jgi:hypothetical protein